MLTPFTATDAVDYPGLTALVDWYEAAGVAGLFAVSQSSEMFDLTPDERMSIAAHVVEQADVPVVATGTFGGSIEDQATFVDELADTGVDAVVVNAAQLVDRTADEAAWMDAFTELVDRTQVALGIYECPEPYHRTLSPETVAAVAETGRVRFYKDTCPIFDEVTAKIAAADGSRLNIYDADARTLGPSLRAGAAGYSGIAANVYPALLCWLCDSLDDPAAVELTEFLTVADHAIRNKYPMSAKATLARGGFDINTHCRSTEHRLVARDDWTIEALRSQVDHWRETLELPDPFAAI